ncbi:MAG: hydroxysqualene dehydroxylase HpnE [Planctomycetaceae bacterium]|nr:hydroxysqualene dehydroxylase HpnE [Planctomycetaceae bacterium]
MPTLAVIGGGLSGITAALSAARKGLQVSLFERTKVLGGRVASMYEPKSGQWIDNGQHLLLGCCTELLALHQQLGLNEFFEHKTAIPFADISGKRWSFAPSPLLPGSLRYLPALFKNPFLTFREKIQMVLLLRQLSQAVQKTDGLNKNGLNKIFASLILSALSETPENVAPEALQCIVQKLFFEGKDAAGVYIPKVPLRNIYNDAAAKKLKEKGVELNFLQRVERFNTETMDGTSSVANIQFTNGSQRSFDYYIAAVPSFRFGQLADASEMDEAFVNSLALDQFEPGAVTTVHLWFDQPLPLNGQSFFALLGGPGQFIFEEAGSPFYYTVVISASHRLLSDNELTAKGALPLVERVTEQLRRTFPQKSGGQILPANVKHYRVTTYFDAVFSPSPAVYAHRPSAATPYSNLFLAGDWIQTGFPSTMEGAVRSGLNAVEQIQTGTVTDSTRRSTTASTACR